MENNVKNRFDIKVLFVDDNEDLLRMRKDSFSDFFRIATANDIGQALLTVKWWSIDIVVTDKNMWGSRWIIPLLDYMKNEQPGTPVIINSGEDGIRASKELYCHAYIEKFSSDDPTQQMEEKIVKLVDKMRN